MRITNYELGRAHLDTNYGYAGEVPERRRGGSFRNYRIEVEVHSDEDNDAHTLLRSLMGADLNVNDINNARDFAHQDPRLCYRKDHPACLEHAWMAAECKAGVHAEREIDFKCGNQVPQTKTFKNVVAVTKHFCSKLCPSLPQPANVVEHGDVPRVRW